MKKIEIQGKRNQDKMKQMDEPDAVIERKMPKNRVVLPDGFYATDQSLGLDVLKVHIANISIGTILGLGQGQSTVIMGGIANTDMVLSYILREIDTKRKAYIYQDKHHEIYDPRYSITTERIVELLVSSELLCYYCREICQVTYKESMCRKQWTLDRIDNNYGHNDTNVVIACLDCNLKRGTMDSERFRQGKQFTFRKVE
jgi:5-methylcytosine-specific restriction endonuclease McrA